MPADAVAIGWHRPAAISSAAFDEIHHWPTLLFSSRGRCRDAATSADEEKLDYRAWDEYRGDASEFAEQHVGGTCA